MIQELGPQLITEEFRHEEAQIVLMVIFRSHWATHWTIRL